MEIEEEAGGGALSSKCSPVSKWGELKSFVQGGETGAEGGYIIRGREEKEKETEDKEYRRKKNNR